MANGDQDKRLTTARGLVDYALHLRMYGERAPGGDETWQTWDRAADRYMRRLLRDPEVRQGNGLLDAMVADIRCAIEDDVALDRSATADEAATVAMDAAERVLRDNVEFVNALDREALAVALHATESHGPEAVAIKPYCLLCDRRATDLAPLLGLV